MYTQELYQMIKPPILAGPYPILNVLKDEVVADFAKRGIKITGIAERGVSVESTTKSLQTEKASMLLPPKGFAGGIRAPHVHYDGDIYLLNNREWKAFSGKIIEEFKAKLSNAQAINYDQLMRLSDIMQDII